MDTTAAPIPTIEPPKRDGRGRPRKKPDLHEDKKRRTTRASRQPAAAPPIDLATTHPALDHATPYTVASRLCSNDADEVSCALNGLLRASADVEVNYCLGVGGERVVDALCRLLDGSIGWEGGWGDELGECLEPRAAHWEPSSLVGRHKRWREYCRERFGSPLASSSDPKLLMEESEARILDVVVAILRNLSFVSQNLRFLAHSQNGLRILTGALYYRGYSIDIRGGDHDKDKGGEDISSSSHQSNACVYAIQALTNMAPFIDITGRQIFIDRVFLESDEKEVTATVPQQRIPGNEQEVGTADPTYGIASRLGFGGMYLAKQYDGKAETIDAISDEIVWALVGSHVTTTLSIFPALTAIMDPNDTTTVTTSASGWHRPSVIAILELFTALVENTANKGIFLCIPDSLLQQFTELLFLPRLGPDSLDYVDPVRNVVTRVIALKFTSYDSTVDSDLRDRTCELLVKLTELSPDIRRRLGMVKYTTHGNNTGSIFAEQVDASPTTTTPTSKLTLSPHRMNVRLYDSLISMISATTGRMDAGSLAAQLLTNMATVPENRAGMMYVERKLISVSTKDPHVANIACNGIFNRIK